MKKLIQNFLKDESGVTAAEYAILIGAVGVGVYVAATSFTTDLKTGFTAAAACVKAGGTAAACK